MKKRILQIIALFTVFNLLWELTFPVAAWALTGGPSQPEVQSFEPVGTTEMVNVFTGDYVYNLPLMDVGGFPINLSYHSGVGMDQEASWVGLGWNINPGVINRNMRGLPDDFAGDQVVKKYHKRPNRTYGLKVGTGFELFGFDSVGKLITKADTTKTATDVLNVRLGLGVYYNNYAGLGYEFSIAPALSAINKNKEADGLTASLGLSVNSQSGIDVSPNLVFTDPKNGHGSFSPTYNSRAGLKALSIDFELNKQIYLSKENKRKELSSGSVTFRNRGSTISLNPVTYVPQFSLPLINRSYNLTAKFGSEIVGLAPSTSFGGYYSQHALMRNEIKAPAYGYLYSQYNKNKDNALLDFNRENDGSFTKNTPNLNLTNYTYDLYSVSGEGVGGMFRPYRGDIGVVHDPTVENFTTGLGVGPEFGTGQAAKGGVNISGNYGYSVSGAWRPGIKKTSDFAVIDDLNFKNQVSSSYYEPAYFRNAGEMGVSNQNFYDAIGNDIPVRIELKRGVKDITPSRNLKNADHSYVQSTSSKPSRGKTREKRNQHISSLNAQEAAKIGLDKHIESYAENTFTLTSNQWYFTPHAVDSRTDNENHHTSEITVTNPNGNRYVYGIPAYNRKQLEVSFNVSESATKDRSTGMVTYGTDDNSVKNTNGEDHFYSSTELPDYAHSYLLTAVLSPDYVDITGDGISPDDIGQATKLNYTKVHNNYHWRVPHGGTSDRQANYNEGLKSWEYDDKGNYLYGEKEIWYLHSIENKNYVACFYTSDREDGVDAKDENGNTATSPHKSKKLDKIELYSKAEMQAKGSNAQPLKTVFFEYDYSLCPSVENNTGTAVDAKGNAPSTLPNVNTAKGKLTLKKVFITYRGSHKGRLSPYQFTYSDFNPPYNLKGYDRWGNYKYNPTETEAGNLDDASKPLHTSDNPYVTQNKDTLDHYATAWHLKGIQLPSGGKIAIEYESDDYAYVQDKRAMQMFSIVDLRSDPADFNPASPNNNLFDNTSKEENVYALFKLNTPIPNTGDYNARFYREYLNNGAGIDHINFKCLIDITNKGDYEFVSGYAQLAESYGLYASPGSTNAYDYGYIQLKRVTRKDNDKRLAKNKLVHPISFAAWQFGKLYMPKQMQAIFSGYVPPPGDASLASIKTLAGTLLDVKAMFGGYYKTLQNKNCGRDLVLNKSFIRLFNPDQNKLGGGSRVKKVSLSDEWKALLDNDTQADTKSYGQEYFYTQVEEQADGSMKTISSGVAAYEPQIGGEENPFKQPITYIDKLALIPDNRFYQEHPLGESFFPAPSVGYAQIKVVQTKPSTDIKRTATGYVVHEFYTAKDFPVIPDQTDLNMSRIKPNPVLKLFSLGISDNMTVSQGFSIQLNDMHGKPKAQTVYAENNPVPISSVRYEYLTDPNNQKKLYNKVNTVMPDGSITQRTIGKDIDLVADTRYSQQYNYSGSRNFNADGFFLGAIPAVVPIMWTLMTADKVKFQSISTTKVIYRFGILAKTIATENGAEVHTENMLYDGETGEVLLTKTYNEFSDPIYAFNYPAHWAYEGMGPAYENTGLWFKDVTIRNGELENISTPESFFKPGDELLIEQVDATSGDINQVLGDRIWVSESLEEPGKVIFIRRSGLLVNLISSTTHKYNLKIIRSGQRNMQTVSIGSFTSRTNPINGSNQFDFKDILNAGAVEFDDYWASEYKGHIADINFPCGCSDSCWLNLITKIIFNQFGSQPPALPQFNFDPSDTINLMDDDYRDLFLCVVNSYNCNGTKCAPSLLLKDSLLTGDVSGQSYFMPLFNGSPSFGYTGTLKNSGPSTDLTFFTSLTTDQPSPSINNTYTLTNRLSQQTQVATPPGCDYMDDCDSLIEIDLGGSGCTLQLCFSPTKDTASGTLNKAESIPCLENVGFRYSYLCDDPAIPDTCTIFGRIVCEGDGGPIAALCPYHPGLGLCNSGECRVGYDSLKVNPYVYGLKGNWRNKRSWEYLDQRKQADNIRIDGTYDTFSSFWNYNSTDNLWKKPTTTTKWTWNSMVTKINRTGNEIENVDALNRYSGALYDYDQTLPVAVASNARHRQLAFDGFEDYNYINNPNEGHFNYKREILAPDNAIVDTVAHTGNYAIWVDSATSITSKRALFYPEQYDTINGRLISPNVHFLQPYEMLELFSPDSGEYVISAWIRELHDAPQTSYNDTIRVTFTPKNPQEHTLSYSFAPSGPIIEGWQRVEGRFKVTSSTDWACIFVQLEATDHAAYFDDIRIHPVNSNMKSFVYNPETMWLMAELDENNYATFYEYDEQGNLVRVKRETERGIMTIQESRTHTSKP